MPPFRFTKKLGVIHEDKPALHPLGAVQAPVALPSTYMLDPNGPFFQLKALMQYETPDCGGFSLAQLINFLAVLKGAQSLQLSGSFDYAYEKTIDGYPQQDGTTITAIGKAGSTVGSCLETLFPDATQALDTTAPFSQASPEAIADAKTRILGTPFQLDDLSIEGIRQACFQNGGVILEVQLGDEWYTNLEGADDWSAAGVLPIRPPKSVIDSHFILVTAYDEPNDRLWFINSWSDQWGQNGFGYFNSNYQPFIQSGIAFKTVPQSVTQALTAGQQSIATQILKDMGLIIQDIEQEI